MPKPELLETFDNPYANRDYEIHMDCSEFTSLCPVGGIESDAEELALLKGGAPDFGTATVVVPTMPGAGPKTSAAAGRMTAISKTA